MVKGLLFASPWIVGFLLWTAYPIAASLYYSLCRYDVISSPKFIGLENYAYMLHGDKTFPIVMHNTLFFVLVGVPAGLGVAWLLANLLNTELRFRSAFRAVFFVPSIVPVVASVCVWQWMYDPLYGLLNSILRGVGMSTIPWLSSPALAKPSLIIIHCWAQGGAIVIFLAALQGVPRSLYDAALVDGANGWQRFRHVTVPMCTPAILFVLLTSLIGVFQYFTFGWLLTEGGPNRATEFYGLYLYRSAFRYFKMGYASALAWLLFLLIVICTILIFRTSARWVYYGGKVE